MTTLEWILVVMIGMWVVEIATRLIPILRKPMLKATRARAKAKANIAEYFDIEDVRPQVHIPDVESSTIKSETTEVEYSDKLEKLKQLIKE